MLMTGLLANLSVLNATSQYYPLVLSASSQLYALLQGAGRLSACANLYFVVMYLLKLFLCEIKSALLVF